MQRKKSQTIKPVRNVSYNPTIINIAPVWMIPAQKSYGRLLDGRGGSGGGT